MLRANGNIQPMCAFQWCVYMKMINVSEIISLWLGRTLILKSRANYILLAVVDFAELASLKIQRQFEPIHAFRIYLWPHLLASNSILSLCIFYPMHKYGESKSVDEYIQLYDTETEIFASRRGN